MVNKIAYFFLIVFIFIPFPKSAFAASFTASTKLSNVTVGEGFTLEFRLSGAQPKGGPDLTVLEDNFIVYSTRQSSQTTIVNNNVSSSVNWIVTLMPKKEGTITIPAISIQSDAGILNSQTIDIQVEKPSNIAQNGDDRTLFIDMQISKLNPYKNEPVLLTARLVARKSITNIGLSEIEVPNSIVEQIGNPEIYDAVLQGQRVKLIEARYLITPLESGSITIPPFVFQGEVESNRRRNSISSPFEVFGGMGFASYDPFAVSSEEIVLDVKPPEENMKIWLPAYSYEVVGQWDGVDSAKVGEPLTLKLKTAAKGLAGTSLLSLEEQVFLSNDFKVYSDNPVMKNDFTTDSDFIIGQREEVYTVIPQKEGEITFPEIKVEWWDIKNEKLAVSIVPAKTINIVQGTSQAKNTSEVIVQEGISDNSNSLNSKSPEEGLGHSIVAPSVPIYLYAIILTLFVAVLILGGVVIFLFKKVSLYKQSEGGADQIKSRTVPANEDKVYLSDIKKENTAKGLLLFLQNYTHQNWGVPRNASVQTISEYLKNRNPESDTSILQDLDLALYAGAELDIPDLSKRLYAVLKAPKNKVNDSIKLTALNPS